MSNDFNNWKKINNMTKKVSMVKKKRWLLGFLLTTIFLAFLIPGGYFLSKQIADTFTIKNIRASTGNNTGDEGNGNGDDGTNDNLKPLTEVTREIILDGQFVPIETNNISMESFRIKQLNYLIENDLDDFFKTDMFFKTKKIRYKYRSLLNNQSDKIDLDFIQQDSERKEVLLEDLQINDEINDYKVKFNFNLKIINTHLFYQRYLSEYNFQSVEVDNLNTEMGYLPIKWLYADKPLTGILLYEKVNAALDKFFRHHNHEFGDGELLIEPQLRTHKIENELDDQEILRALINNSEDKVNINECYLYFKSRNDSNIKSFALLNKINNDYIKSFSIITELYEYYTTLNFAREILGLNFEIPEMNLNDSSAIIKKSFENSIYYKVDKYVNQGKKLVDDINILKFANENSNRIGGVSKISVNNDMPIGNKGIYKYNAEFVSESYPKFTFNVSGYLKMEKMR